MTDRDMLEQILSEMKSMKSDVIEIKTKVGTIDSRVETIDSKVDRNYDKTIEFYVQQKEYNTQISNMFEDMISRIEIFENQTIKNTSAIRCIK